MKAKRWDCMEVFKNGGTNNVGPFMDIVAAMSHSERALKGCPTMKAVVITMNGRCHRTARRSRRADDNGKIFFA